MRTWEARIGVRLVLDGRAWRGGERRSGVVMMFEGGTLIVLVAWL